MQLSEASISETTEGAGCARNQGPIGLEGHPDTKLINKLCIVNIKLYIFLSFLFTILRNATSPARAVLRAGRAERQPWAPRETFRVQ